MSSTSFQLNNEIIRAGAGAGKTTTLTKKVIQTSFDFYHIHRCFPRMVVTTFSRKATQELRERLVVEGIKTDREDFLEYISSRSSLHISTIHGVLSLFLRRYGHLLNIDSGFQIIGETDATLLAKGVLRQLLLEDPEQNQILETWSLRDLTHMLRGYHSALMADPSIRFPDVPALYQLLTQYLERNCETLKRAVEAAIEETTISSWKEYLGRLKVISERLRNLNSMDDWNEVKNLVEHLGRKPPFSSKRQGEAYSADLKITIDQAWKELSDKMKKPGIDPSSWLTLLDHGRSFESLAQEFHQRFLTAKEKSGRLEMSDLELLTWQKLQAHPEIGAAFSQDWDYWLIDEFQDTSPLQVELLRCLIGDRQSFLVGDPQQSIYLFRGARSEVFQQKWNEIGANGGVLGEKRTNFRSTPALLHFFNEFFSQVGDQFQPMEAKSESHSSSSLAASTRAVATFAIAKQVSGGEEPEYSEMAAIVSHIYQLRQLQFFFQILTHRKLRSQIPR